MIDDYALPTDIPWKRMGVSKDMLDPRGGDAYFPFKWRSSIAVFFHEPAPDDLPPAYCSRRITFLKVSATITNYQYYGEEDVSVLAQLNRRLGDYVVGTKFEDSIGRSYPCYGAMIQVGAFCGDEDDDIELHDQPFFTSVQPRKRELVEVLTQSGEVGSQSATKLNVTKGSTTTDSLEDYDLDLGGGGGGVVFGLASWTNSNKQEGTIQRSQGQDQDVKTTDASREKRESYSHSTSLNQLRTLLQAYHVGTNRCVLFLEPHPHMQDGRFTFIQGPRRLEGIQDFFFVIDRPREFDKLCVDVTLETAHLHTWRGYSPRIVAAHEVLSPEARDRTPAALRVNASQRFPYYDRLVKSWNGLLPWVRYAIGASQLAGSANWPPDVERAIANGSLSQERVVDAAALLGLAPDIGIEDAALLLDEYDTNTGRMFVTGRRVCSCLHSDAEAQPDEGRGAFIEETTDGEGAQRTESMMEGASPNGGHDLKRARGCEESLAEHVSECGSQGMVLYEKVYAGPVLSPDVVRSLAIARNGPVSVTGQSLLENTIASDMQRLLRESQRSERRYANGGIPLLQTEFGIEELRVLVEAVVQGNGDEAADLLGDLRAGEIPGVEALSMTTSQVAETLKVEMGVARRLRHEFLLSILKRCDPDHVAKAEDLTNTRLGLGLGARQARDVAREGIATAPDTAPESGSRWPRVKSLWPRRLR